MRIRDLMIHEVATCTADTDLAQAAELMRIQNCGALPVLDASGHLYGIVTDRDICMGVAPRHLPPAHIAVREVMTRPVRTCGADDEVAAALLAMRTHGVRRLPVVDTDRHLQGIVSVSDIVRADGHGGITETELLDALRVIGTRGRQPVTAA